MAAYISIHQHTSLTTVSVSTEHQPAGLNPCADSMLRLAAARRSFLPLSNIACNAHLYLSKKEEKTVGEHLALTLKLGTRQAAQQGSKRLSRKAAEEHETALTSSMSPTFISPMCLDILPVGYTFRVRVRARVRVRV